MAVNEPVPTIEQGMISYLDLAASMAVYPPVHEVATTTDNETLELVGQARDKLGRIQDLVGYSNLSNTAGLFIEGGLYEPWRNETSFDDRRHAIGAIGLLHDYVDTAAKGVTPETARASIPAGVEETWESIDLQQLIDRREVARHATLLGGKILSAFTVFDATNVEIIGKYILLPTVNDLVHMRVGTARNFTLERVRALGNDVSIY